MRTYKLTIMAGLAIAITLIAPPARAEDWEYDLVIYGLAASMDGTAGVGALDADVDVGFSDILDNLEAGGMVAFRAKRGRWAVMTDAIVMGLGAANDRVDVDIDQYVVEVDLAYELNEVFEVLFGARYVDIDGAIDFRGPLGTSLRGGESWIDPLVGLRVEAPLSEKWLFIGRLDVGGAGVGSDFTYNAVLSFGYRVGERSTLAFGWRTLDIDFEDGEGTDRFKYDVSSSGPLVGVMFHF